MAITLNALTVSKFGWMVNGITADGSTCEELVASPGAGKSIVVDHITLNNGAAGTQDISIGAGESGNNCETVLIGPVSMAVNDSVQWNFGNGGMVLPTNKSLTVDSGDTHNFMVFAYGRIQ